SGDLLADLATAGARFVAAHGGKGGRGNIHFATSTNQAPRQAEEGSPGEERNLHLELRLLADAGLLGYPNVGKSTFIARVSRPRPRPPPPPQDRRLPLHPPPPQPRRRRPLRRPQLRPRRHPRPHPRRRRGPRPRPPLPAPRRAHPRAPPPRRAQPRPRAL